MLNRILNQWKFFRQCLVLLAGERRTFAVFIVLSALAALTEGMGVSLLAPLLDAQRAIGQPSAFANIPVLGAVTKSFSDMPPERWVQAVVAALAIVLILRNALQYTVDVLSATIPLRLEQEFNRRSYDQLMAVEISFVQQTESGNLLNGLGGWSQQVTFLLTNAAAFIWNAMSVTVYLALMLLTSWRLTIVALVFLTLISWMLKWLTSSALQRAGERVTRAVSRVNQVVIETLAGMKAIRLSAAEPQLTWTYREALNEKTQQSRHIARVQALSGPLLSTCAGLFICALLFGASIYYSGEPLMWVAPILLFLLLLFRLMNPISTMNVARNRIVTNMFAFDQLQSFYAETSRRRQQSGLRQAPPISRSIVFDDVGFSYRAGEPPVVQGLALTIKKGEMIAIVGPSGAGKTTLAALVARLYDPQHGRILIDDVDLREFDVRSWRQRIAMVAQDTFIFNASVRSNIGFGHENVPVEKIRDAARLAAAEEFIEALPQGYDTILGDRGVRLSGGQQQRVAIARAILADPDFLILDEATSNLDTINERAIQSAMSLLSKDRTLLVIAHRLSTIRKANCVVVMEAGRIVEQGRHQELLARRGAYWDMVEHQRLDLVDEDVPAESEPAA
jgi:subfamily B ATP-binding cassette protein MsbA